MDGLDGMDGSQKPAQMEIETIFFSHRLEVKHLEIWPNMVKPAKPRVFTNSRLVEKATTEMKPRWSKKLGFRPSKNSYKTKRIRPRLIQDKL